MLEAYDSEQLERLLDSLPYRVAMPPDMADFFTKTGTLPTVPSDFRRFGRRRLRQEAVCEVTTTLPAIERECGYHRVYLRDISRGGISFLHSEQLFPLEQVVLWTHAGKLRSLVCRCVKKSDNAYEVGAKFAETIVV